MPFSSYTLGHTAPCIPSARRTEFSWYETDVLYKDKLERQLALGLNNDFITWSPWQLQALCMYVWSGRLADLLTYLQVFGLDVGIKFVADGFGKVMDGIEKMGLVVPCRSSALAYHKV